MTGSRFPPSSSRRLDVEPAVSGKVAGALRKKGHNVRSISRGVVQLIKVDMNGVVDGASDPRKGGKPATARDGACCVN